MWKVKYVYYTKQHFYKIGSNVLFIVYFITVGRLHKNQLFVGTLKFRYKPLSPEKRIASLISLILFLICVFTYITTKSTLFVCKRTWFKEGKAFFQRNSYINKLDFERIHKYSKNVSLCHLWIKSYLIDKTFYVIYTMNLGEL